MPVAWLPVLLGLFLTGAADAARLDIELGRIEHAAFTAENVRVTLNLVQATGTLSIARFSALGRVWADLRLHCSEFAVAAASIECGRGTLTLPGSRETLDVQFAYDPDAGTARAQVRSAAGELVRAGLASSGEFRAVLSDVAIGRFAEVMPQLAEWQAQGRLNAQIDYRPDPSARITASGRLHGGGFSSADGLQAAEGLGIEFDVRGMFREGGWDWGGRLAWGEGEAYLHPIYLAAGPVLEAEGRLQGDRLTLGNAKLALEGVDAIEARGDFELDPLRVRRAAISVGGADLGRIGPDFIAPVLAPARAATLRFAGTVGGAAAFVEDRLVGLDLSFDDAAVAMDDVDVGFGPLNGRLPWRADSPTDIDIAVGGGHWQQLTLGAFALAARVEGLSIEVPRLAVPVLDGRLILGDLALRRIAAGWTGRGNATIEPVSMALLAEAVGLPPMSGVLSASLPGLRVDPGELALDGTLVVSVFDGYLRATNLRWLEPFGVASHLFVDVEARPLDLTQLTAAFAFGSITGRLDADVRGLELARWRPVRFAAELRSSPGRYPRRISQRAVQNIGALGGPGAAMAIQRGFLGFFETFGYSEIGLSCVLRDGVCAMDGIPGARPGTPGDGFVIVRGGGIPALNVIGYNRRVDWDELLERLQRVIATNVPPVIE